MTKYKVGDRVKIREDLKAGETYGGYYFYSSMCQFKGENMTIAQVDDGDDSYLMKENEEWFSEEMISRKVRTPKPDVLPVVDGVKKDMEKLIEKMSEKLDDNTKAMKSIGENLNKRTMYDDITIELIKNKIKEVPMEELMSDVLLNVDTYIKNVYGTLPTKIEITNNEVTKEMTGIFHKKFDEILNIVNKGVPLMLTGPAGAGKNHTLEQVAEALDLEFYFTNAITQEYKLTGFIDANGVYQETQFYKAFKDGGLFFLDEVDASCPESLIILNSAIANGYFDFPNGRVNVHEKFRVVCAGNTFGTGADMVYVGRNALDGATLDRFATMEFDYDENVEKQLAHDDELYKFIVDLRKAIKKSSLRYIVSMRATINASKLIEIGINQEEILKSVIIKNMQVDDLNTICKKINTNSSWGQCLLKVKNQMDQEVAV